MSPHMWPCILHDSTKENHMQNKTEIKIDEKYIQYKQRQ